MSKLTVRPRDERLPISVPIIIALLVLTGSASVISLASGAMNGPSHVGCLGVINLVAAIGLSRRCDGWRKFMLVELSLVLFLCIIRLTAPVLLELAYSFLARVFGRSPDELEAKLSIETRFFAVGSVSLALGVGVVSGWMLWALTRLRVRAIFASYQVRPLGALVQLSAARLVGRMEQLQRRGKHGAVESQISRIEDAIADLQALRERMSGPNGEAMLAEAIERVDDILARAMRVRESHLAHRSGFKA